MKKFLIILIFSFFAMLQNSSAQIQTIINGLAGPVTITGSNILITTNTNSVGGTIIITNTNSGGSVGNFILSLNGSGTGTLIMNGTQGGLTIASGTINAAGAVYNSPTINTPNIVGGSASGLTINSLLISSGTIPAGGVLTNSGTISGGTIVGSTFNTTNSINAGAINSGTLVLGNISINGMLGVVNGGTGKSSWSLNSFVYASGSTTLSSGVFGVDFTLTSGTLALSATNNSINELAGLNSANGAIALKFGNILQVQGASSSRIVFQDAAGDVYYVMGGNSINGLTQNNGSISVDAFNRILENNSTTTLDWGLRQLQNGDWTVTAGNLAISTAGKGLQVKFGPNCRILSGTLSSGVATINNSTVTANTHIFAQDTDSSNLTFGSLTVFTSGTTITVKSTLGVTDNSTFDLFLVEGL